MLYSTVESSNEDADPLPIPLSDQEVPRSNWKDWRWHLRHSIRDIEAVEKLLDIDFTPSKKFVENWKALKYGIKEFK